MFIKTSILAQKLIVLYPFKLKTNCHLVNTSQYWGYLILNRKGLCKIMNFKAKVNILLILLINSYGNSLKCAIIWRKMGKLFYYFSNFICF